MARTSAQDLESIQIPFEPVTLYSKTTDQSFHLQLRAGIKRLCSSTNSAFPTFILPLFSLVFSDSKINLMSRLPIITAIIGCSLFSSVSAQIPSYVPDEGLVLFMGFNGDVNDNSGTGNNGTPHGIQYTTDRFGNLEMAAEFGSSRWIEISHSASINFALGDSLTWSIWVRTSPSSIGQTIFHKWNGIIQSTGYPLQAGAGLGEVISSSSFCANSQSSHGAVATSVESGNWIHALMTQTADSTILYINGLPVDTGIINQSGCSNSTPLTIGRKFGVYPRYFEGDMDEFGLWNRTLTEGEVQALYISEQILGCTDTLSCNYSAEATLHDESCIPSGCMDDNACNFNTIAGCDDGSCDYSCCPGPGCCLNGTVWDWMSNGCVVSNPTDVDLDGCTGVTDVLEVLSLFGQCLNTDESSPWACEDPLTYQSYDYATVQIGNQCWFAENLRSALYADGSFIPTGLTNGQWTSGDNPGTAIYGQSGSPCDDDYMTNICNPDTAYLLFGQLYNWHAVNSDNSLCPSGWIVPSDNDWLELESFIEQDSPSFPLVDHLKGQTGWYDNGNGLDTYGFNALPGGNRTAFDGDYNYAGSRCQFWSSTSASSGEAWRRQIRHGNSSNYRSSNLKQHGFSIRCLKE